MAWTAPKTFVANAILTAAELNVHLRDNLSETAPAKATTSGSMFVGNGANRIVERIPNGATVAPLEATASTTFTDLTTPGPAVTVTTGAKAVVIMNAEFYNVDNSYAIASVQVSGASSIAPADTRALTHRSITSGITPVIGCARVLWFSNLTPGNNVFTMKYRAFAGTSRFQNRELIVIPL